MGWGQWPLTCEAGGGVGSRKSVARNLSSNSVASHSPPVSPRVRDPASYPRVRGLTRGCMQSPAPRVGSDLNRSTGSRTHPGLHAVTRAPRAFARALANHHSNRRRSTSVIVARLKPVRLCCVASELQPRSSRCLRKTPQYTWNVPPVCSRAETRAPKHPSPESE